MAKFYLLLRLWTCCWFIINPVVLAQYRLSKLQNIFRVLSTITKLGFAIVMNYDFVCQACVVATLAALAYNQPHGMVPFLKVSIPFRMSSKHFT